MKGYRSLLALLLLVPLTTFALLTPIIQKGDSGTQVTELQTFLTQQGYFTSAITGYYGTVTTNAVKAYQQANGISTTGRVGSLTAYTSNLAAASTTLIRPTITLSASPNPVVASTSATVSWTTSYATACKLSNVSGTTGITASYITPALKTVTTYTLTCVGPGGISSKSVTIGVTTSPSSPTISLSASPNPVVANTASSLSWSSTNTTSCTSSWGTVGTTGTYLTPSLTSTSTYTLTCTGTNGSSISKQVVVGVMTSGGTAINGTCGTSNNQSLTVAPTTNLCTTGTASSVSGSGPWSWTCGGVNGGTTVSCSAPLAVVTPPGTGTTYHYFIFSKK